MNLEVQKSNNFISIDKEQKQIVIQLDYPGELWSVICNAPQTDVVMNFRSLDVKTEGDMSFTTSDNHYILLNTTREQYEEWLAHNKEILEKLNSHSACSLENKGS